MATCYRHPNRQTGVACSNCGRAICTDCMTPTNVGMRCPECARERTRVVRPSRMPQFGTSGLSATHILIALNVIAFVAELAAGGKIGDGGGGTLYEKGVLWGPFVHFDHQYYRLITYGFLHDGLLHIFFNMWFIWVIGGMLEPIYGRARFVALYFAALLAGAFGVLLLGPSDPTVGASGAAFGLLGAMIIEARARGIDLWASGLLITAVLNFAITFAIPGISLGGHVGGFAGGLVVGLVYRFVDKNRMPRYVGVLAAVAIGVIAFVGGIAIIGSRLPGTF
ncbi:MAG TPA: rhomboid family intramembrane serine protease [Conexibacter sp.]|jgi:membrane associated rhomboid family serine protease